MLLRFRICALSLVASFASVARADEDVPEVPRVLVVDSNPGSEQPRAPLVLTKNLSAEARAPDRGAVRWSALGGTTLAGGSSAPPGGIRLVPVEPGVASLPLATGPVPITVIAAHLQDERSAPVSTIALSRELPAALQLPGTPPPIDEGFRIVFEGHGGEIPATLDLVSETNGGEYVDSLRRIGLVSAECPQTESEAPGPVDRTCATTPLLRLVADVVEKTHPAISGETLLGALGGTLTVNFHDTAAYRVRVLAPRALDPNGPGRYLVKVRARIVRTHAGGPPSVGASDEEAIQVVRDEIESASRMWQKCGIAIGEGASVDVGVVDPPELSLLTVGCGRGLPSGGGTIRMKVNGRQLSLRTSAGQSVASVASALSERLRDVGIRVEMFQNARISRAAGKSYDLVLRDERGRSVRIDPFQGARLSDDPSLEICRGALNLSDGLEHFTDENAASGTSEERMLLRALADSDPSTIELFVVPIFGGLGRIGESFIFSPGSSVENALILDRTGIRAGARSFTLAHELGHILLDMPGHPDDFGVDTPTSLMDADAADPTIFGPRRLSLGDCRRALRQSGKGSPTQLIFDWPLP